MEFNRSVSPLEGYTDKSSAAVAADAASYSSDAPETELRQTLKERHVNMIGFSTVLGVGLFLSAGKSIFLAGPGVAVISYLVVGTILWSVMACMGEMTALFPVKGPTFEFTRRFVDESIGIATGWITWFTWCTYAAAEVLAITEMFKFQFDPSYLKQIEYPEQSLQWKAGVTTSPAVWVGIFLIITLLINLLPVRQYGRIEYVVGCLKIIFLVGIIMFNIIINARKRFHSDNFWTYDRPWGFSSQNMTIIADSPGKPGLVFHGALGKLCATWSAMTTTLFSLMGWEIILFTAAENYDLRRTETVKLATRKIAIRVLLLYTLAAFTVGLNVPYTDDNLRNLTINGISGGQNSIFIIAAVREHVRFLPHLMNGFFIFSGTSTAINSLYGASRVLHALASIREAWPQWGPIESVRSRLERTRLGVPMTAVFISWLVGLLAFLSTKTAQADTLGRIATAGTVASLIMYAMNCIAYLKFYSALGAAAKGECDEDLNLTPEMRNFYKRSAKQYPYRSHLQWIRAVYALVGCVLMTLFQGWRTFISPMSVKDFVASYVAIILFLVISIAYFFKTRGFAPRYWRLRVSHLNGLESVGPVVVEASSGPCKTCGARHRRGYLRLPNKNFFTTGNMKAIGEWIWVWLK